MCSTDRVGFIRDMIKLAQDEPKGFHGTETLAERAVQYAGTARPRVTVEEVWITMERMGMADVRDLR